MSPYMFLIMIINKKNLIFNTIFCYYVKKLLKFVITKEIQDFNKVVPWGGGSFTA